MVGGRNGRGAELGQGRSAEDGAQAAQRRADAAGAQSERDPRRPRDRAADEQADERAWTAAGWSRDGTARARDQAARMHDSAASLHDEAVRLGIGDSDEHRRSAARHREAATSHRPGTHRTPDGDTVQHASGGRPQACDDDT
jgi:hypothetical protein